MAHSNLIWKRPVTIGVVMLANVLIFAGRKQAVRHLKNLEKATYTG